MVIMNKIIPVLQVALIVTLASASVGKTKADAMSPPTYRTIETLGIPACDHWGRWFAAKAVGTGEIHGLYHGGRTTRAFPFAPQPSPALMAVLVHEPAPVNKLKSPNIYKARLCFFRGMQLVREAKTGSSHISPIIESKFLADYAWFQLAYNLRVYPWTKFVQLEHEALSLNSRNADALYFLVWADVHRYARIGFIRKPGAPIFYSPKLTYNYPTISSWTLPSTIYRRCMKHLHEAERIKPKFFEALRMEAYLWNFNFLCIGPIGPIDSNFRKDSRFAMRAKNMAFETVDHASPFLLGMSMKKFYRRFARAIIGIMVTEPEIFKKYREILPKQLAKYAEKDLLEARKQHEIR